MLDELDGKGIKVGCCWSCCTQQAIQCQASKPAGSKHRAAFLCRFTDQQRLHDDAASWGPKAMTVSADYGLHSQEDATSCNSLQVLASQASGPKDKKACIVSDLTGFLHCLLQLESFSEAAMSNM